MTNGELELDGDCVPRWHRAKNGFDHSILTNNNKMITTNCLFTANAIALCQKKLKDNTSQTRHRMKAEVN